MVEESAACKTWWACVGAASLTPDSIRPLPVMQFFILSSIGSTCSACAASSIKHSNANDVWNEPNPRMDPDGMAGEANATASTRARGK